MPKVRTLRSRKMPAGWEVVCDALEEFGLQMKDAENAPMDAQTKEETMWRIHRLHHQRSRYVYDIFYGKKEISRQLYDYLLRQKYGDANLIAKWKKGGYEKLCCLTCINTKNTQYGSTCICRVPKADLEEGKLVICKCCGCRGCSSND